MNISFRTKKLKKQCNKEKDGIKAWGPERARKVRQRLGQLRAADCLADLRNAPGRLHELHQNRAGQLSLDLDGPWRLIFVPDHDPVPCKADGGLDWVSVTAVRILEVADTHA